jgi:hypothetical protein
MPWWLLAIMVVLVFAAWWWIPKWEMRPLRSIILDPKAQADVEDNLRKSVGQLIGGAFVIAAAYLAYFQTQETLKAQDEQSKRSVISQQISKGFELLGEKDNPIKRLGGIYALEGVMNDSGEYHEAIVEALCAFVRENTKAVSNEAPPEVDTQAALNVVKRRHEGAGVCVLTRARIPQVVLSNAPLPGAVLDGTNLNHGRLAGIQLDQGASLIGAHMEDTELFGAHLEYANLNCADLIGARPISAFFTRAHLIGANLSNSNLNGALLKDAQLDGARLDNADLSDALELTQDQLNKACGSGTQLPPGFNIKPCSPPDQAAGPATACRSQ